MKRSTTRILVATAIAGIGLVGIGAAGFAHGDFGRGEWRGHDGGYGFGRGGAMREMMQAYDTNGDGKLTQEEITQGRANQLKKYDSNGDGTLDLAEYQALWMDVMRERMVRRFQQHDANGDGKITQEEFGKGFDHMVEFMDTNGDGVLDMQDVQDMRARHHRGPMGDSDNKN